MAEHLVAIYGTEKDKVNCPFYYKIGACRHGDRCSRQHNKPLFSQTILMENMYTTPDQIKAAAHAQGLPEPNIPAEDLRCHFDDFYHDVMDEMSSFGTVESVHVCENRADHLAGNTYVKFRDEEAAKAALASVQGRLYAGRVIKAEYSPVTDFREGKCRPFERSGMCDRGDYCHFMHLRRHPGQDVEPEAHRDDYRSRHSDRGRYGDGRRSSRDYDRYDGGGRRPSYSDRDRERDRGYDRNPRTRDYQYERSDRYDRNERDRGRRSSGGDDRGYRY